MTGHRDRAERIQDLLDGHLPPTEEAEVRRLVRDDPAWRRDHLELSATCALLRTPLDIVPPADLHAGILRAVAARRVAGRLRLPTRIENVLVVLGGVVLAAVVLGGPRWIATGGGAGWLGPVAVGIAQIVGAGVDAAGRFAVSAAHLDWVARLLATLSGAARTVLATSAQPLLVLGVLAFTITALVAYALVRAEKGPRGGGLRHAHLAF